MRRKIVNKRSYFNFIDPGGVMAVVVSLIILAVGVFAFFVTLDTINSSIENSTADDSVKNTSQNISRTGNQVFNIVGIVLIIGAIMAVVGLVYNFVGRPSPSYREERNKTTEVKIKALKMKKLVDKKKETKEKFDEIKEKPKKKKDGWQI